MLLISIAIFDALHNQEVQQNTILLDCCVYIAVITGITFCCFASIAYPSIDSLATTKLPAVLLKSSEDELAVRRVKDARSVPSLLYRLNGTSTALRTPEGYWTLSLESPVMKLAISEPSLAMPPKGTSPLPPVTLNISVSTSSYRGHHLVNK